MRSFRPGWIWSFVWVGTAWATIGCASSPCNSDQDCKGARICEMNVCVDVDGSGAGGSSGPGGGASGPGTGGGTTGSGGSEGGNCVTWGGKVVCVQQSDAAAGSPPPGGGLVPVPPGGIPPSADIGLGGFAVPDQGGCGSCVAFATRNAMAIRSIVQTGTFTDFSPAHIWHTAGYGSDDCDVGSSIYTVFDAQMGDGPYIVPTTVWPYSTSNPEASLDDVPPPNVLSEGGIAHIDNAHWVQAKALDDLKAAIAQGWPPVVSVNVYGLSGWASGDGNIDVPPPGAQLDGRHAVTLISYDDATSRFGFVNSWGADWANGGYGTMTYAFLQQYMNGGMAPTQLAYKPTAGCNDGKIDPGETCDGGDFGGATCKSLGHDGGSLQCNGCQISTAGCCDDACDPGATQCQGQSQQTCTKPAGQCAAWGPSQTCQYGCMNGACVSVTCGDNTKNGNEQCDGPSLGGATCATLGYDGGMLLCDAGSCTFDKSQCCMDQCDVGQTTCSSGQEKSCQSGGTCNVWSAPKSCQYGCNGGKCAGPCDNVVCNSPNQCQFGGTCSNGTCQYQNKPPGTSCDDGNGATQNDMCDGAGSCDGCVPSYSADWVCETYNTGSGLGAEIFSICTKIAADGMATIKVKKTDGSTFGSRPYQVEVSNPADGSCGPSNWFFQDVTANMTGIGTSTLTFTFMPNWQAGQTQKAYCVTASTKSGDIGYDPNNNQQKSWWYSKKVVVTKSCQ